MMQRLALNLSAHNYLIRHKPKSNNASADYFTNEPEDSEEVNLFLKLIRFLSPATFWSKKLKLSKGPVLAEDG